MIQNSICLYFFKILLLDKSGSYLSNLCQRNSPLKRFYSFQEHFSSSFYQRRRRLHQDVLIFILIYSYLYQTSSRLSRDSLFFSPSPKILHFTVFPFFLIYLSVLHYFLWCSQLFQRSSSCSSWPYFLWYFT